MRTLYFLMARVPAKSPLRGVGGLLTLLFALPLFAQEKHFTAQDLEEKGKTAIEEKFTLTEIPVYTGVSGNGKIFLENGYAQSPIKNATAWPLKNQKVEVTEINLIYTKYPVDKNLWRTNYRKLLTDRLKALFKLDPSLNSDEIEWNIILQTSCKNEPQAMQLLHGIEIVFEPVAAPEEAQTTIVTEDPVITETKQEGDTAIEMQQADKQVQKFIKKLGVPTDSTVEKVFDRNCKNWKSSLVVMDWTGSMMGFGAQLVWWYTKHFKTSGIKYVVVFNDLKWWDKKRKPGNYEGIYYTPATDIKQVIKLMKKAKNQGGQSNDLEENNVEALIKATTTYKDFTDLVMIADNRSCMKDYCLACNVKQPVHIVLCGTHGGINPQYVNLAYLTGGSIHTIESDLLNLPASPADGDELKIDNSVFKFDKKKNRYMATGKRAYQNCKRFYRMKCGCGKG